MSAEDTPQSIDAFLALIPKPNKPSNIVECTKSDHGRDFFRGFKGARITNISLIRYDHVDVIALLTDDGRVMGVVADKGGFIAIEGRDAQNPSADANLAFRSDISHRRLNLALSLRSSEDVTYQDPSFVHGEVVEIDPAATFVNAALPEGVEIDEVFPSWCPEDWMNISRAPGKRSGLTIRADDQKILGAVTFGEEGMNIMNIGDNSIEDIVDFGQPPLGVIPACNQLP